MIKIIHKKGAHLSSDERRLLTIHYAKEIHARYGRLNIKLLKETISCLTFSSSDELVKAAGLPVDAVYGSDNCYFCGNRFVRLVSNAKFCSKGCQVKSGSRRALGRGDTSCYSVLCKCCGKSYRYNESGSGSIYCSKECSKRAGSRSGNKKRRARKNNVQSLSYERFSIIDRDGGNCRHCGVLCSIDGDSCDDNFINLDHIIPLSRGGHDADYNIQVLCRKCNNKKGHSISAKDYSLAVSLWPEDLSDHIKNAKVNPFTKPNKSSKSKVRGVFFDDRRGVNGLWVARIERKGERVTLCYADSLDKAVKVRKEAARMAAAGIELSVIKREVMHLWQTPENRKH